MRAWLDTALKGQRMTVLTMIRLEQDLSVTDCGLTYLMMEELYSPEGSITLPSLSTDLEILKVVRIEAAAIQIVDMAI